MFSIAAFSALGGAVVGALSVAVTTFITQRSETRRRMSDNLFRAATVVWMRKIKHAEAHGGAVHPLSDFIVDFMSLTSVIEVLERDGVSSDEKLIAAMRAQDKRFEKITQYRRESLKAPTAKCHASPPA